ncbi:cell division protein FtsL [Cohnella endophytica]|uniref:Cell division protein FtsL n=1 Tax=Cohnella endophytica TaxID=2419778 RepID=A0A494Y1K4_9BACL|nr:cell division protein FtsL [Cohnella endophytica]RKP55263.1 cell division protein FtsL [Cohnella endophytica]
MAYYGNLALRPERVEEQRAQPAVRQQQQQQSIKSKVTKRRSIPIGEKLLYLFSIALVVFVAGFVIFRYAQIYQINGQVQASTKAYTQATEKAKELQQQIDQLSASSRITKWAEEHGFERQTDNKVKVKVKDDRSAVASKH